MVRERQIVADDASARFQHADEAVRLAQEVVNECQAEIAPPADRKKELEGLFRENKNELIKKKVKP